MNIIYSLCWIAPNIDVLSHDSLPPFFTCGLSYLSLMCHDRREVDSSETVPGWFDRRQGAGVRDSVTAIWADGSRVDNRVVLVLFSNLTFCIDCTLIFLMSQWSHKGYYYLKARLDNRARCSTEVRTCQARRAPGWLSPIFTGNCLVYRFSYLGRHRLSFLPRTESVSPTLMLFGSGRFLIRLKLTRVAM